MSKKFIAFDPGGTTGWAIRDVDGTFRRGVFDKEDHYLELWKFLRIEAPTQIICERFNYQRRDLDKGVHLVLISRNYIGVIELFSQMREVPLYMSQVSNKDFWSDQNLRDLDLWARTQHERDATAHLLWYLTMVEKDRQYIHKAKGHSRGK